MRASSAGAMTKDCDSTSTCWLRAGRAGQRQSDTLRPLLIDSARTPLHEQPRPVSLPFLHENARVKALYPSAHCRPGGLTLHAASRVGQLVMCCHTPLLPCDCHSAGIQRTALLPPARSHAATNQQTSHIRHITATQQYCQASINTPFSSSLLIKPSLRHAIHSAHNGPCGANHSARPGAHADGRWFMVRRV